VELMTHPGIAEAVVFALPHPHAGEQACAVVIPSDPAAPLDLETLRRYLKERGLAPVQWPERVENVTLYPRTSTGKVLRDVLRSRLSDDPRGETPP
jgi:non-ribosomal peptide synthetase component E (peptide arylation enzyme)